MLCFIFSRISLNLWKFSFRNFPFINNKQILEIYYFFFFFNIFVNMCVINRKSNSNFSNCSLMYFVFQMKIWFCLCSVTKKYVIGSISWYKAFLTSFFAGKIILYTNQILSWLVCASFRRILFKKCSSAKSETFATQKPEYVAWNWKRITSIEISLSYVNSYIYQLFVPLESTMYFLEEKISFPLSHSHEIRRCFATSVWKSVLKVTFRLWHLLWMIHELCMYTKDYIDFNRRINMTKKEYHHSNSFECSFTYYVWDI